jgi:hypothetical protein
MGNTAPVAQIAGPPPGSVVTPINGCRAQQIPAEIKGLPPGSAATPTNGGSDTGDYQNR